MVPKAEMIGRACHMLDRTAIVLAVALTASTPALSQQRDRLDGQGKVKFGMSVEQVRRVYPEVRINKHPPTATDSGTSLARTTELETGRAGFVYLFDPDNKLYKISIEDHENRNVDDLERCQKIFRTLLGMLQSTHGRPTVGPTEKVEHTEAYYDNFSLVTWDFKNGSKIELSNRFMFGRRGRAFCLATVQYIDAVKGKERL